MEMKQTSMMNMSSSSSAQYAAGAQMSCANDERNIVAILMGIALAVSILLISHTIRNALVLMISIIIILVVLVHLVLLVVTEKKKSLV